MAQACRVVSVGIAEKTCEITFTGISGHANYPGSLSFKGCSGSYLVLGIDSRKNEGSGLVREGGEEKWGLFGNFRGFFGFVALLSLTDVRVSSQNSSVERVLL